MLIEDEKESGFWEEAHNAGSEAQIIKLQGNISVGITVVIFVYSINYIFNVSIKKWYLEGRSIGIVRCNKIIHFIFISTLLKNF